MTLRSADTRRRFWAIGTLVILLISGCAQSQASPSASPLPDRPAGLAASPLPATLTPVPTLKAVTGIPLPTPNLPLTLAPLGPTTPGRVENLVEVGHHALGSRGWNAGLALNYPCAYVGNRRLPQVAIVDVSDPAQPTLANELLLAPGSQPVELRAVPDLGLLVVLNFVPDLSVLTFDVSDCRDPKPLGSLGLGAEGHEFFLWRDPARPSRLLMYVAMFKFEGPDLQVVDLSDPTAPRVITTWTAQGEGALGRLHSLSLSRDGRRAYLALWEGGFLVADTSDLAEDLPDPQVRLVRDAAGVFAPAPGRSVHSAVPLTDSHYMLLTQEVYSCPFAGLFIADILDEAHPHVVGRFDLPENDPACNALPQPDAIFTSHNPLVVGNLVFVTWYGGGLQVLDVSDPTTPHRVGLFVPSGEGAASGSYVGTYPVQLWSYPILREGLIYVSDIQSGLYILRYTGPGADRVAVVPLAEGNITLP